jgi:hypothetical protein
MRVSHGDDIAAATPDGWHIGKAIACVAAAGTMSLSDMASLEFAFFKLLEHDQHGTPNLDRVLAENPGDFVHLVSLIYKRDDGEVDRQEGRKQPLIQLGDCSTMAGVYREHPMMAP